jgi:hypothetical protein
MHALAPEEGRSMAGKRELIQPTRRGKRFVRRDDEGKFTGDQTSVGRSLAQDRRRAAKSTAKPGYGDRGDRKSGGRQKRAR